MHFLKTELFVGNRKIMPFHISEHLFALDLIDLVMKRRSDESLMREQSLPLTPEIRRFVYSFLDKEEMRINEIFTSVQENQIINNDTFPVLVRAFRPYSFDFINAVDDMLTYCIIMCQITLLVYKNGGLLAPSIALEEISDFVKKYISAGLQSENSDFFGFFRMRLGIKSQLSIEQPTTFSADEATADIQSVKRDKLQKLYNHLKKQF
ncbi:hypothetical protein TNCV_743331 [Trichonephila clavipes]|nr:hypothetical protein TNCV_743331 [Trichonephila clavipes]